MTPTEKIAKIEDTIKNKLSDPKDIEGLFYGYGKRDGYKEGYEDGKKEERINDLYKENKYKSIGFEEGVEAERNRIRALIEKKMETCFYDDGGKVLIADCQDDYYLFKEILGGLDGKE